MEVIPAIDLLEGRCVRLYQGDYDQSEIFDDNPVAVARQWQEQGATRLHLVDLDGAKSGKPENWQAIEAIVRRWRCPSKWAVACEISNGLANCFKWGCGMPF
jgi:phosphoribosylformimino-5-aminoimidazole carboxamide ribotide isomerase